MAGLGNYCLPDRTLRDDVHASERSDQRRVHLFHACDPCDSDLRKIHLRMGMSYRRSAGSLCVGDEEVRDHSAAVPLETARLRPAHRRPLHVRLAHRRPIPREARERAVIPAVH